jgi:hypothetical protein
MSTPCLSWNSQNGCVGSFRSIGCATTNHLETDSDASDPNRKGVC